MKKRTVNCIICFAVGLLIGFIASLQWGMIEKRAEEIKKEEDSVTIEKANILWRTNHFAINHDNVKNEILAQSLDFPEVVMAQAAIETGGFTSSSCLKDGNLFGIRNADGTYRKFRHWTESVAYYKEHIQKYDSLPKDYYRYLDKLGYAENPQYTEVIRGVAQKYDFSKKEGED